MAKNANPLEVAPERRFDTIEEWAEHRHQLGRVVPEEHPAFEEWMRDFA